MLTAVVLISIAAGAVISLLYAIRVGDRTLEVISKGAASVSFVALGLVRWTSGDMVGTWLVAALVLCAVGDFCLLWPRSFDSGLISFLLGHLAYVAGFSVALPIRQWPPAPLIALVVIGGFTLRWLWPTLGSRRISVTLYIIVISAMMWGGTSLFVRNALPWTAAIGALLFYLSDLAVARHRFVYKSFVNRALGLPVYYLAQILLALTVSAR